MEGGGGGGPITFGRKATYVILYKVEQIVTYILPKLGAL